MTLSEKSWILVFFVATVFSSAWWPQLPSWLCIAVGSGVVILTHYFRYPSAQLLGTLLGVWVVTSHGSLLSEQKRTLFQADENITIIAQVDSPFKQISHGYEAIVAVEQINGEIVPFLFRPKIRLRTQFDITDATRLHINVNIKPIVGLLNEVGFDAEKAALSEGIVGIARHVADVSWHTWTEPSVRGRFVNRLEKHFAELDLGHWLRAISYGERNGLNAGDWDDLKRSGLAHLVTISGLHIGMAFGVGFSFGLLFRLVHPSLFFSPYIVGLALALSYAWLADFTIPTLRAFIMCSMFLLCRFALVTLQSWRLLLICVSLVLTLWPFSIFSTSFWLSFLCVAAVMIAVQQVKLRDDSFRGRVISFLEVQCWVTVLVLPITILFFSGTSISSYLYNLVFIPWFAVIVVPLMMASTFLTALGFSFSIVFWECVELSLRPLLYAMSFAENSWVKVPTSLGVTCFVLLCLFLFRIHLTKRASIFFVLLGIVLPRFKDEPAESWQMDVFDVGHGLAVLVSKGNELLLYDTGKAWESGSNAQNIIVPAINQRGYTNIDTFVVSHTDNDHAGGYEAVIKHLKPRRILSSQKLTETQPCIAGYQWHWNGLLAEALWPPRQVTRAYNPHSCVIRLTDLKYGHSILLTGDIEQIAEWILVRQPEKLDSDVLIVPHHGSQSSSNLRFVEAVSPNLAIASTAKLNQWNLPNINVVERYRNLGSEWFDTGNYGQITVTFTSSGIDVTSMRSNTFSPWYRHMLRKGVE